MKKGDEKSLLIDFGDDPNKYGADNGSRDTPKARETASGGTQAPAGNAGQGDGKKRPWWKRDKVLQRHPSLDKVDEDFESDYPEERKSYPGKLFGVKSYLHHFYDSRNAFKDPDIYEEEDDFQYLLHPSQRRRRCTSIWWKVFVWIGCNFLIFGIIGVLVGYLVPQRTVILDNLDNVQMINPAALEFNRNLDVCKLVGLILFCVGGLTLAVALLFPSFLYHYCDVYEETERREAAAGSFKVHMGEEKPPTSPLEMQVPTSSKITGVQPDRKAQESIVTKEGMFKYTE